MSSDKTTQWLPVVAIAHWDWEINKLLADILDAANRAEARNILISALNATYKRGFEANDT